MTVPKGYVAKMSANDTKVEHADSKDIFYFESSIPIPSYLIAIVVGDLERRKVGPRTGIITEPALLDTAEHDFGDLEKVLTMTEEYLTPYIWGEYNVVFLPYSFPYNGMENPLITFANAAMLTGDKSQFYVATHEIVHSWMGNLVTNKNWSYFWLNEGFTTYVERKVSAKYYGKD